MSPRVPLRTVTVPLSLFASGALLMSGCGLANQLTGDDSEPGPDPEPEESTEEETDEESDLAQPGHDPLVREGRLFLDTGQDGRIRLAINALQRTDDVTVLDYELTFVDQLTGTNENLSSIPRIVDPVSGQVYEPLLDEDDAAYGTYPGDRDLYPIFEEAPNVWRLYYPRIPDHVEHATFVGYGMGHMSGIPVADVDEPAQLPTPNFDDYDDMDPPAPGTDITYPDHAPPADVAGEPISMESFVDSGVASTTRDGDSETISLHSDVTFDHDEATLSGDAEEIVQEAAKTIEGNIDPDATDITVIGHTDSTGSDDYNQDLSEERAETVRELLEEELGDDFTFEVEGRGSGDPIADESGSDEEEAQARNRRVEFSYEVDSSAQGAADGDDETLDAGDRNIADPARFQEEDGEVVATATEDDVQLDVHPLVRDGAYLWGTVSLTNTSNEALRPDMTDEDALPEGGPEQFSEGTLGGFQLLEPDTDLVRYVAQVKYDEDEYDAFAEEVHELQPGEDYRTVALFPAPPKDVDELTLRAGPFGELDGIPIE
ncbi:OmpA family protein [Lipingzhangella sp. LS1_29]|uniref:OmpA family protein n=1 Tax=Lipingzhangella rawalii TaxID=2055835 RepID=A0ABU2H450_9ACTN|nr:OmpA family protein [Lipingzhangella rawalii]MDS1270082.1 OmpA family protein [Lipingzhangella rawalii]